MLILEPVWVFATVGFCIACARRQMTHVTDIWGNRYFSAILVMMAAVFVPVENWILHKHTDWETTFMIRESSDSTLIALATLLHILVALASYRLSIYILHTFGDVILTKMSMWAFTIFFSSQGMFYDSLMYPGSYDEYHSGVRKSFWSFFLSDTFRDTYIVFFIYFGPVFYYLCISWNSGGTKEELCSFIKLLTDEVKLHVILISAFYLAFYILGWLPTGWGLWRLVFTAVSHVVPHVLLISPLRFCPTKEHYQ